jgi:hypothetical protein
MTAPVTTVAAPPDLSLTQLATLVEQQEEVLGPLLSIGNDGSQTLLTFDLERDPPESHTAIGIGDPPPNSATLTTGKVFVAGELRDVRAFRAP